MISLTLHFQCKVIKNDFILVTNTSSLNIKIYASYLEQLFSYSLKAVYTKLIKNIFCAH